MGIFLVFRFSNPHGIFFCEALNFFFLSFAPSLVSCLKKWETKSCLSLAIYAWNFRTDTFFFLLGYPKAEYAIGYFTEMGIGCRRDPLEANVWYVRAADQGDDRAKQRLA